MSSPRSWRVGHVGRDQMFYEEQRDGAWQRLNLDGEMLMGRAHHVIYFDSPAAWSSHPLWARDRRGEIVARIKSAFREPDYEYADPGDPPAGDGDGAATPGAPASGAATEAPPPTPPQAPPLRDTSHAATPQQRNALLLAIALVFTIAGVASWASLGGLASGATRWPGTRPSQRRVVQRTSEPIMFYTALGVYAVLGLGTLSLGVWGLGQLRSLRVSPSAMGR